MKTAKIRLYLDHDLASGERVSLSQDQANYLFNVMRLVKDDALFVFNGRGPEYLARVEAGNKRSGVLAIGDETRPHLAPPDLWLLFAPIKKARTDFIVEKATEMGVARIRPVLTEYTNGDRVRDDKLRAHIIEASEQCGATFVPALDPAIKLAALLKDWPTDRHLMFCDEAALGEALTLDPALRAPGQKWAIIIGPEGGFSPSERAALTDLPQSVRIALGPRILRADTAAVAALALWQSHLGDWQWH